MGLACLPSSLLSSSSLSSACPVHLPILSLLSSSSPHPQLVQFLSPSSACCPVPLPVLSLSSSSPLLLPLLVDSESIFFSLPMWTVDQWLSGILQAFRITMGLFGTAETCSLVDWVSTQYGHSYCILKANLANSSLIYIHSISYGLLENPS